MQLFNKAIVQKYAYLLAASLVLVATVIRLALASLLEEHAPLLIFTLPIVISALYLGFGPAIFATFLAGLVGTYLFVGGIGVAQLGMAHYVTIGLFIAISLLISFLGKELKASQQSILLAKRQLEEEGKRKDEFLAMLSHELRNPLAAISAANAILKFAQPETSHVMKTHAVITRQVRHMTKIIDDLVDVSRVTRGLVSIEKNPVDVKDIIRNAVDQMDSSIQTKRHHLRLQFPDEPVFVEGDATRLFQVLSNLLDNAVKYTPAGGAIEVGLRVESDRLEITVADNGVGIPSELLPHVFDMFVQGARSLDRSQGGLGIGLALVKSIVEIHGGRVSVQSDGVDKGSQFTVVLPRWLANPAAVQNEISDGPSAMGQDKEKFTLFVVDDNRDAAQSLAMLLELEGHQVFVEHDSKQALSFASTHSLDVLLLDIGLPEMNGYELAKSLRAMPHLSQSIFIAISGYAQEADKERAKAAGFDYHFAKPVEASSLMQLLNKINPSSRQQQSDHLVSS